MPDMWMDVDTALAEVPVNILPLTDDTDFKSREESVAYNAAGMELIWHFTTTAGATTATVVTPTTGGAYDWAHQDGGMYTIEIPASGGASINNDTEGFGWFTGVATGVLPWRGPTIGFRAAALNNLLIDDAYSATRGLAGTALPNAAADAAGGLPISDAGGLDLDTYIKRLEAAFTSTIAGYIDAAISTRAPETGGALAGLATTVGVAGAGLTAITGVKLHADYDAAKTAAAAGAKMDLVDAPNGTAVTAIQSGLATSANQTTILNRLGAWTGSGVNTVLGAFKALLTKVASAPSDIGGTFDPATDSTEALRERGDAAWATATGFSTHSAADVKTAVEAAGSHLTLIKAKTDNLPANTSTVLGTPAGASLAADIAGVTAPSAADVADAVADELLSGHTTAGSLAKAISDILTDTETTLDGKLNTIDDFLDTEIALILKWFTNKLTRTDNGTTVTYVLYDDDDSTPLKTWVWTKATTTRAKAS